MTLFIKIFAIFVLKEVIEWTYVVIKCHPVAFTMKVRLRHMTLNDECKEDFNEKDWKSLKKFVKLYNNSRKFKVFLTNYFVEDYLNGGKTRKIDTYFMIQVANDWPFWIK